jgi:hypothetical protein
LQAEKHKESRRRLPRTVPQFGQKPENRLFQKWTWKWDKIIQQSNAFQFSTFKLSKRAITASMIALSRSSIAIASVIFAFWSLDGTSDDRGDALDSDLPWPLV